MSQSIGKQLMEARKKKGLTLEDVSFKTRIPLSRLNELENDDFSNFANLTYAKSFLRLYSEHLGLDIGAYLSEWDTKELAHVYGRQYMQSGTTGVGALSVAPAPLRSRLRAEPPRGSTGTPWWLLILALGGLIALPIWLMKNKGEESADDAPRKPRPNPTSTSPSGATTPSTPAGTTSTTPTTPTDTKRPEPFADPSPPPNSTAPTTTAPATTAPPLPANEPNSGSPPKARPVGEGVLPTQPEKNPGDVVPKIEDLPAPATPDASPPKPRIIPG